MGEEDNEEDNETREMDEAALADRRNRLRRSRKREAGRESAKKFGERERSLATFLRRPNSFRTAFSDAQSAF